MTLAETEGFKSLLRTKESELTRALCHLEEIIIDKASETLDEVQIKRVRELVIGNFARDSTILRQIRGALARIADGTFGVCLRCEGDISPKRMAAVPWAGFCMKCQEKVDRGAAALDGTMEWLARVA